MYELLKCLMETCKYLCFVELSLVLLVEFDGVLEFFENLVSGLTPDGFRTVICDERLTRRDHLVRNLESNRTYGPFTPKDGEGNVFTGVWLSTGGGGGEGRGTPGQDRVPLPSLPSPWSGQGSLSLPFPFLLPASPSLYPPPLPPPSQWYRFLSLPLPPLLSLPLLPPPFPLSSSPWSEQGLTLPPPARGTPLFPPSPPPPLPQPYRIRPGLLCCAGGMPLAFTQEDFLVKFHVFGSSSNSYENNCASLYILCL